MQRVRSVEPSSVKAAFLHVQLWMFQIALDWSRMIHTLSVASPIMTVSQPSCLVCRTLTFRVTCLCASQRHPCTASQSAVVWYMIAMRMLLVALAISFCVADYKLVDREDFPAASECVWNAEATEVNTWCPIVDVSNSIGLVKDVTCTVSCKPSNDGEPTIISCMMDFYMQCELPVCQPAACLNGTPIGRGVTHVAMRM